MVPSPYKPLCYNVKYQQIGEQLTLSLFAKRATVAPLLISLTRVYSGKADFMYNSSWADFLSNKYMKIYGMKQCYRQIFSKFNGQSQKLILIPVANVVVTESIGVIPFEQ